MRNWEKDEIKEVMSISDRSYFRYRRRVRKAILIHMSWYDYGSEYIERLVESVK